MPASHLVVDEEDVRAVLGWEQCHLGYPHEDRAFLCLRHGRLGGPCPVGGFGSRQDVIAGYESPEAGRSTQRCLAGTTYG
ncbi:MAG: hypothetical protein JO342_05270 [Solirubrobacterales bacterium]|nr:hypothetical protein [Solirubrobacterales bacterium]